MKSDKELVESYFQIPTSAKSDGTFLQEEEGVCGGVP